MKSYQFLYSNKYKFIDQLMQIKNEYINESNNIFFYLTWANQERQVLDEVTELLSDYFPEAFYYGSESAGNIINGGLEFGIAVCCYVLEEKQSRIKPIWVEQGTEYNSLDKLWEFCRNEKGIRAVELAPSLSYLGELRIDNNIPNIGDDICIFGGVSVCMDSMNMGAKILAKGHGVVEDGMIAVIYYGDNLNFSSNYVLGWKGLGRYMTVTKSHNKVIEEIDSVPPFSIYEKYLDISREDSANIVFPLIIVEDDVEYIRTPQMILPDKTMRMFADIEEGVSARMAYGDKNTILKSLFEKATEVADFQPQILRAYSCIARRLFWGDDEINKETVPLQKIARSLAKVTARLSS